MTSGRVAQSNELLNTSRRTVKALALNNLYACCLVRPVLGSNWAELELDQNEPERDVRSEVQHLL